MRCWYACLFSTGKLYSFTAFTVGERYSDHAEFRVEFCYLPRASERNHVGRFDDDLIDGHEIHVGQAD